MSPVRAGAMALMVLCIGSGLVSRAAAADDNPYGLIDAKTISVGTMGDAKPYVFTLADGTFTGFDIELFRNVASRIGFKPDQVIFTGQEFSALMPSVANGRFDVAVAAIGTTDARKKTVDFSDGYLAGYLSVLTADKAITSAEGLKGKRLGVVQGTLQEI
ncbi:MAG: amino acid ABC transporter substrate-binding protein, partial [Mesorhizobium sp.]